MSNKQVIFFIFVIASFGCTKNSAERQEAKPLLSVAQETNDQVKTPSSTSNPTKSNNRIEYHIKNKIEQVGTNFGSLLGIQENGEVVFFTSSITFNNNAISTIVEMNVLTKQVQKYQCDFEKLDSQIVENYPGAGTVNYPFNFPTYIQMHALSSAQMIFTRDIWLYDRVNNISTSLKKEAWKLNRQTGECENIDRNLIGQKTGVMDFNNFKLLNTNVGLNTGSKINIERHGSLWQVHVNDRYTLDRFSEPFVDLLPIQSNSNAVLFTTGHEQSPSNLRRHKLYLGFGDFKNSSVFNFFVGFDSPKMQFLVSSLSEQSHLLLVYSNPRNCNRMNRDYCMNFIDDVFLVDLSASDRE